MRTLVSLFAGIIALVAIRDVSAQRGEGPDPAAVRAENTRFAGIWKLVAEEMRDSKGQIVLPRNASNGGRFGYIAYDAAGYMGVTLSWLKQPTFAASQPTPQEALAAMGSYNSYWGSFVVNEARGIVTHQTFGALSPAFSGTNQERGFSFSGNRLTLRPPTSANGDQRALTWERLSDLPNLTPTHRKLIGFWKLISFERRNAKGELSSSDSPWMGFLVYTASGHVMVHMMQPYRRRNVGPSPTPEETMATYRSYTSYFGPFTVNESENYVVHHIAASFNSGQVGTDFQRFLEFSGKRLTLKPAVAKDSKGQGGETRIVWERLSN